MRFELEIDPAKGVARVRLVGYPTVDGVARMYRTLRTDPRFRPGIHLLHDVREVSELPPLDELEQLMRVLVGQSEGLAGTRHAIVGERPALQAYTELAALQLDRAPHAGMQMRFFDDPEQALAWLQQDDKPDPVAAERPLSRS